MPTVTNAVSYYGVKEGRLLEWQSSRLKMGIAQVVFGTSENYATGGIAVADAIKSALNINTIHFVAVIGHDVVGWMPYYDASTGKLQFFGQEPTGTDAGVLALSEMGNGSAAINDKTVNLLVIGT